MIDAHIHLDQYKDSEIEWMMASDEEITEFITVSSNLESCKRNLQLSNKFDKIRSAFGFHPEQSLPTEQEKNTLIQWMEQHQAEMIAVGEVGLPYYLRQNGKISKYQYNQYLECLEVFIKLAKSWNKPIVLHAVYEDAPVVCDLLEKNSVSKAHFHWFKGDDKTITRMAENGYFISVTPEIVYKKKIQQLIKNYPLEQIMVETDGPWEFKGPFKGKMTHPHMMSHSIAEISKIKGLSIIDTAEEIHTNTKNFYKLN
ncbi:TatD family hydrolase [Niallia sp. XMNu-256]|uniref:TatD family hydrolase n=1 Tax=Niallia sp. XMNu-256 TaxID=3082444 RepID=UPI0030CBCEC3